MRCADGRNHELVIVSLICAEAKRQGKQYTKRMLPWFVIPECNIRLDLVVKLQHLVERDPGSGMRLAYEQADAVIGSASERTIARHLGWVRRLVAASVLEASELLAELAPFAALPEVRAGGGGLAELWIDDFSRKILFGKYYFDEKLPALLDSLRYCLLRYGIPTRVYVDGFFPPAVRQAPHARRHLPFPRPPGGHLAPRLRRRRGGPAATCARCEWA